MAAPRVLPYGSWPSPISAALVAGGTVGISLLRLDGDDIYWLESRSLEGGRSAVVRRRPDGLIEDVTPPAFNARTRVHEYGGGSYTVAGGTVYFSNFSDQRLYRQEGATAPAALTPEGRLRYADLVVDSARERVVCVVEDHRRPGEAVNSIAAVPLAGGPPELLVTGGDFYSTPRLSPDGKSLAWLTWDHPHMPWDQTDLWVARIDADGSLSAHRRVAGGSGESVFQPEWSPESVLHFVSDRTGWWNLYCERDGRVEALTGEEAEFGLPQWIFGLSTYAFITPERIACVALRQGTASLSILDSRGMTPLALPYTAMGSFVCAREGRIVLDAASATESTAIVAVDAATGAHEVLRRSSEVNLNPGYLSEPEAVEFPTAGGLTAHGLFYPPRNRDAIGPVGERPPLLVHIHGGPSSAASSRLNLGGTQYWTSRGFAVLDVNYGGSTGYGRAYRERLRGAWGVVDVQDCVNGALFLAARGDVDRERLLIAGGSAGGFTTLAALAFHDVFAAGASHFGVADLGALARETHKFESRYLDGLVGKYPDRKDLYDRRSPINRPGGFTRPVLVLQGADDRVVPRQQAEAIVLALRSRQIPCAYILFAGEEHGWRRASTMIRALESELSFYGQVLGFPTPGVARIAVENLEPGSSFETDDPG